MIDNYKSCKLHPSKSGVLGLAEVWCFCKGETELDGAHDALTDVKAQMDVVIDDRFWSFIDRKVGWELLESIWVAKRERVSKQQQEAVRNVPIGWDCGDEIKSWTLHNKKNFTSSEGGPLGGPSSKVLDAISNSNHDNSTKLANLFLFYFQKDLLSTIASETNRYGNEDWVKPQQASTAGGEGGKKKVILVPCKSNDEGAKHRYQRAQDEWR